MVFEFSITVRGYEIDSYSHLNHAIYLNYMEQARWEILRKLELSNYFKENNFKLVVVDIHIRYAREAKIFDELKIKTTLKKEEPYLLFTHKIYNIKTDLKICQAEVKSLLIDNEKIPYDLPDEILTIK